MTPRIACLVVGLLSVLIAPLASSQSPPEEPHEAAWEEVKELYDSVVPPVDSLFKCKPDEFYPGTLVDIGFQVTYTQPIPLTDAGFVLRLSEGTHAFLQRAGTDYIYRVFGTLGDLCKLLSDESESTDP